MRRLQEAGHTAYFAGGCVRDMVRGVTPHDFDIATSAPPEVIQTLFSRTVPVGAQFGVILVLADDHPFEVATFRSDAAYLDGRHPSAVRYGTPAEDAQRRDFTINGLFYDPVRGEVLDLVGGQEDIRGQVVRTIGDPGQRFGEDKLRLLRGVRLAASLGYTIEPATFQAIQALAPQIQLVSAERIRDELVKLLTRSNPGRGLRLLAESGLLAQVLPEVAALQGVPQPPQFHPEGDVFTHVGLMLDQLPPSPTVTLAFAVLLHDVGKPPTLRHAADRIRFDDHDRVGAELTRTILRRLRFSNDTVDTVVEMVATHMRFREVQNMRPAKLKRLMARPTFGEELELHRLDCLASHGHLDNHTFLEAQAAATPPEVLRPVPLVTGHDLLALGYPAGPALGQVLREITEQQLEDQLRSREDALDYARQRWSALRPPAL